MLHIDRGLLKSKWKECKRFATHHKIVLGVGFALAVALLLIIPTASAAMTPSNIFYPLKRAGESVITAIAPTRTMRAGLKLSFANRRIQEVVRVVTEAGTTNEATKLTFIGPSVVHAASTANNDTKTAEIVNQLLSSFKKSYAEATQVLDENLTTTNSKPASDVRAAQKAAVDSYAKLALLRIQAPDNAQLEILTSIDTIQNYLATSADALGQPPVSSSDLSQLSKLIPVGILSKSTVDSLADNKITNRQFHAKLEGLVKSGQLPSDVIYRLDQDLIKQVAPDQLSNFETAAEFEQMQRISATIQASRPTEDQQKAIQDYLSKYKAGQAIPQNEIKPFVVPIVYGMTLAGELQADLNGLKKVNLSSDDQALLDSWEGSLASHQENLGQLYQQFMTKASNQPDLYLRSLVRVQEELVAAEKADVSHLVLPPGWGADQLGNLNKLVGIQVAEAQFLDTKPNTETQLASVTVTQQQLQTNLDGLKKTQATNVTNLETHVNNFTGTPEQITELKETLALLKDSHSNATTTLQTQLTQIDKARTTLHSSLETLTKQQLISLTELELRAANNAQTLSDSTKKELTTRLNQIEQTNQALTDGLQTKVDGLDVGQINLREELTADIEMVRSNYTALEAYTTAELATGRAATDQLQTELQTVATSLTTHATQLTQLNATTDSLTQLINTVNTDANNQVDQLQSQLNGLSVEQTALHLSIDTLQMEQTAAMADVAGQLAQLNILQTEANAAITTITQTQTATQTALNNLGNDFTALESALATTQQAYTTIAGTVANQQAELDSFQTQTQSVLDQMTADQTQLANQVTGLANNATTLNQTVTALQTSSTATQSELDTLLANPPWSIIPEGTFVTQAQFDTLQSSINAQFATKSAALDQQFQTFQQTVNAAVNQLNTTVTNLQTTVTNQGTQATQQATEQAQLKQTVTTLQSQVTTLQSQVQALTNPGL